MRGSSHTVPPSTWSRLRTRVAPGMWFCAAGLLAVTAAWPARGQTVEELRDLSIDQLANVQVTSVAKSAQKLSDAPAAIYVISHDDIIRSGAQTLPEMLRLAPNLEVVQLSATSYAISARGFNVGDNASLSNKLLVMIDGRTVYTPLFGGVYWDMQSVLPDDVDHIEVISGPGATLWGANAVNGVINVITRNSKDTQGGVLTVGGGNLERSASLQYGGRLGQDLTYRVRLEGSDTSAYVTPQGHNSGDGWDKPQGGFRLDYTPGADNVSVQGDIFGANEDPSGFVKGRDVMADWQHNFADGSNVHLLAYYDGYGRYQNNGAGFTVDIGDIELQHSFALSDWNHIVWGAGERGFNYGFENTDLQLVPARRYLNLANVFAQDTMNLSRSVNLTVGLKLEDEPYAGVQPLPSVRISWKATDTILLWSAVSRAVRSPTPVDESIREYAGPIDYLNGSTQFQPETLTAYEVGTRAQLSSRLSFSLSGFYNDYNDLRSIETSPTASELPLVFANLLAGQVYGAELWGDYRPTGWWRLAVSFTLQHEDLRFKPGSSGVGGLAFTADDPNARASLQSYVDLGSGVTWDASLRYVGALPHPAVPAYCELNTRLGWQVTRALDLSLTGDNLLHARHREFLEEGVTDDVPRSYFMQARWRF
jgi:iron complex outermembrane recepter protein